MTHSEPSVVAEVVLASGQNHLAQASIEVTPKTAARIADFRGLLPQGTRVYIASIGGGNGDDIVETARRLSDNGMNPMPHIVARTTTSARALDCLLGRLATEAGVSEAMTIAGSNGNPIGDFSQSMDLVRTGLFDRHGFRRLHFAGHQVLQWC